MSGNVDEGLLYYPGEVNLEAVVRVEFDSLSDEESARMQFAEEVTRCILHLETNPQWILRNIVLSTGTLDVVSAHEIRTAKVISGENISINTNYLAAIKRLASKNGEVLFEAAFAIPHDSCNLPFDEVKCSVYS